MVTTRYVKKYPARAAEAVCIDVGGVLSKKDNTTFHDGAEIFKAAMPGAYGFIHMVKHRTGKFPRVVSRVVNFPEKKHHWVRRFCESLGLPGTEVVLVGDKKDKMHHTAGATIVIDDDWDALGSMCQGSQETLIDAIWFQPRNRYLPKIRTKGDEWVSHKVHLMDDFGLLMDHLRLQCPEKVQSIFAEGPPNGPHSAELAERALQALTAGTMSSTMTTTATEEEGG